MPSRARGDAITVDPDGSVYVAGTTDSVAIFAAGAPTDDNNGFVMKLSPSGSAVYTTYFGGSNEDNAKGIAHSGGSLYLTGRTWSNNFSTPPGGHGPSAPSIYALKMTDTGDVIQYASFLTGGYGDDQGTGIAVDGSGNAYRERLLLVPWCAVRRRRPSLGDHGARPVGVGGAEVDGLQCSSMGTQASPAAP